MTHPYQISVYKYTAIPDGHAGFTPGVPELQTNAPTWATINNTNGYDVQISLREDTESTFDIFVNYRADFTWIRTMFIISRFGVLDIRNIYESKRKRSVRLEGVLVAGTTGPDTRAGLYVTYGRSVLSSTSISLPAIAGGEPLIFARDGIIKQIVLGVPTIPDQVQWVGGTDFELYPGDIFGNNELITVLYKVEA